MKNKNRKRKYVVALDNDNETNPTALTKGVGGVDVRIRASGKIRNYVTYITKVLTENPEQKVYVYAEDTETCKLATILEILKRSLTQLTSKLTIGNTVSSPCPRREKAKKGTTDLDETLPKSSIYGKGLLKSFTTTATPSKSEQQQQSNAEESTTTTDNKADGSSGRVWMLAELRTTEKD